MLDSARRVKSGLARSRQGADGGQPGGLEQSAGRRRRLASHELAELRPPPQ